MNSRQIDVIRSLVCSSLLTLSCAAFVNEAVASTFDIPSVLFGERRPFANDGIETALSGYDNPSEVLKNGAMAIPKLKDHFLVKIVGYTDNHECVVAECDHLSLKRAQLVYKWMLAHGVSARQLLPPEGRGANDPVGDNATSDGRQLNRRVEFQWIPVSTTH
ncbi:OmpA family protein [Dyella sp. GSA-30]|uniref:OmpA family protein n=1 Tax=Dyella sp. GSA-30 TaxID=2994496 RepID=UPI002491C140|nr:OmpA family protein [Dyella sp. GSA-30]